MMGSTSYNAHSSTPLSTRPSYTVPHFRHQMLIGEIRPSKCIMYRMVPVHPLGQALLGLTWDGVTYIEKALPFGRWSAPKIFSAVADAISWAVMCNGTSGFITTSSSSPPPSTETTNWHLATAIRTCADLGFPVANHKTVSAAQYCYYLPVHPDRLGSRDHLTNLKPCGPCYYPGARRRQPQNLSSCPSWAHLLLLSHRAGPLYATSHPGLRLSSLQQTVQG